MISVLCAGAYAHRVINWRHPVVTVVLGTAVPALVIVGTGFILMGN